MLDFGPSKKTKKNPHESKSLQSRDTLARKALKVQKSQQEKTYLDFIVGGILGPKPRVQTAPGNALP